MVLSDVEIWAELEAGRLRIEPPPTFEAVDSSSVDLTLYNEVIVLPDSSDNRVRGVTISPDTADVMTQVNMFGELVNISNGNSYRMDPGRLVIGKTHQEIEIPNHLAAWVQGKSSLARLGLAVHVTAPTIQAGFSGRLVLEMYNVGPFTLALRAGMNICQIILEHLGLPSKQGYRGRFSGQS